jgi:hypothetical protein
MTTKSTTPCPNCEESRDSFATLLEMAHVDQEDTDELDEPDVIVVKIMEKLHRRYFLLKECRDYLRSIPDYCGEIDCRNQHCSLGARIEKHLHADEK